MTFPKEDWKFTGNMNDVVKLTKLLKVQSEPEIQQPNKKRKVEVIDEDEASYPSVPKHG